MTMQTQPLRRAVRLLMMPAAPLLISAAMITQAAAQPPIIQPGAPGQPSRQITAEEASGLVGLRYTDADVRFMQDMIVHHQQALDMTALVEGRSQRDSIRQLAERIALGQADEIGFMQEWLEERGEALSDPMGHHGGHHMAHDGARQDMMAGMITEEEMAQLEAASGAEFDNLFLQFMITHHQGAVTMVEYLLAQPGSAQDSVLFEFTADVTSEQTNEIERMTGMLAGFNPDPRVGLAAGFDDAGEASWNMNLIASLPKPEGFYDPANPQGLPMQRVGQQGEENPDDEQAEPRPSLLNFANTDIAFDGNRLVAGNYHGFNVYDISEPSYPRLMASVVCPGGQGDVSVYGNLLFMSVEQTRGRMDCGPQGVGQPVSDERFRGIRIFDVSDYTMPVQVGAVQTCRGSHTHTIVPDPNNEDRILLYNSGTSIVRDGEELEGCLDENPYQDENTSRFRIDVIEVPLSRPQDVRIVRSPTIFSDPQSGVIAGLWDGGDHGPRTQRSAQTNHCHDITVYPELGLAAGACSGNGILFDISDPENPTRLHEVIDTNFAYWHSATFNNDGTKVIFTDEWGGGSRARCRSFDPINWGANAIYDIVDGQLEFRSHYKLPAPQSEQENCVAHNGSLLPVPTRDIFVQAWYQGGISVMEFTDSSNPREIAYFDRGPISDERLVMGGYWSAYWHEGHVYGTEIARGLDVFELTPSDYLSANEIAAATVRSIDPLFNPQTQQQHVWPDEPVVALAYVDQLRRSGAIDTAHDSALVTALEQAEALLNGGGTGDAAPVAAQLQAMAGALTSEAAAHSGRTLMRYTGLASTLNGIADRLR